MHEIRVIIDVKTHVTRAGNPDDRWDGDDLSHEWRVVGYTTNLSRWGENAHVRRVDGPVYVVIVDYDTGDSFSHDEHKTCFIDAFTDINVARELAERITKAGATTIEYVNDAGKTVSCYCGTWHGYFERLNRVDVIAALPCESYRIE